MQQGGQRPNMMHGPTVQQLINLLKSPHSDQQQQQLLNILKGNPQLMSYFIRHRQQQVSDSFIL